MLSACAKCRSGSIPIGARHGSAFLLRTFRRAMRSCRIRRPTVSAQALFHANQRLLSPEGFRPSPPCGPCRSEPAPPGGRRGGNGEENPFPGVGISVDRWLPSRPQWPTLVTARRTSPAPGRTRSRVTAAPFVLGHLLRLLLAHPAEAYWQASHSPPFRMASMLQVVFSAVVKTRFVWPVGTEGNVVELSAVG